MHSDADGVNVEARDPEGKIHNFRAAFLIDASGRGNLTGNQENLREMHPTWKKLAVFGHFENVVRDSGEANTDTIIVRLREQMVLDHSAVRRENQRRPRR